MSDDRRVDYDYEMSNGWSKWQNLILAALKENRDGQDRLESKMEQIRIEAAVAAEVARNAASELHALERVVERHDEDMSSIESFRSRMYGALAIVAIVLVPISIPVITTALSGVH